MDIIKIARECGASIGPTSWILSGEKAIFDLPEELQQFAQRIERPHLQRIAELENALRYIKEWTDRYTSPGHPISTVAGRVLSGESK